MASMHTSKAISVVRESRAFYRLSYNLTFRSTFRTRLRIIDRTRARACAFVVTLYGYRVLFLCRLWVAGGCE